MQAKPSSVDEDAAATRRKKIQELRKLLKAKKGWRFPGRLLGKKKTARGRMEDTFTSDEVKKAVDELANAGLWDPSGMDYSVAELLEEDDEEEPAEKGRLQCTNASPKIPPGRPVREPQSETRQRCLDKDDPYLSVRVSTAGLLFAAPVAFSPDTEREGSSHGRTQSVLTRCFLFRHPKRHCHVSSSRL